MSDSLQPHESQHARPPCLSPTPRVHSNSHPSSQWCHPAISSLCRPLLLLPPIPPSIRVFSNESTLCVRWPEYWSFSFSIIPSKEIPGLISFRMDWLDLLAVQGTLKSLLQHHSSRGSENGVLRDGVILVCKNYKQIFLRTLFKTQQLNLPICGRSCYVTWWWCVSDYLTLDTQAYLEIMFFCIALLCDLVQIIQHLWVSTLYVLIENIIQKAK